MSMSDSRRSASISVSLLRLLSPMFSPSCPIRSTPTGPRSSLPCVSIGASQPMPISILAWASPAATRARSADRARSRQGDRHRRRRSACLDSELASRAQLVLARARRASTANQGDAEDWTTGGRQPGGHPVNEELGCPCPSHVTAEPRPWGLRCALRHGLFRSASLRRRRGRAGPRDAMAAILGSRISDLTRLMAVPVYDRRASERPDAS